MSENNGIYFGGWKEAFLQTGRVAITIATIGLINFLNENPNLPLGLCLTAYSPVAVYGFVIVSQLIKKQKEINQDFFSEFPDQDPKVKREKSKKNRQETWKKIKDNWIIMRQREAIRRETKTKDWLDGAARNLISPRNIAEKHRAE